MSRSCAVPKKRSIVSGVPRWTCWSWEILFSKRKPPRPSIRNWRRGARTAPAKQLKVSTAASAPFFPARAALLRKIDHHAYLAFERILSSGHFRDRAHGCGGRGTFGGTTRRDRGGRSPFVRSR